MRQARQLVLASPSRRGVTRRLREAKNFRDVNVPRASSILWWKEDVYPIHVAAKSGDQHLLRLGLKFGAFVRRLVYTHCFHFQASFHTAMLACSYRSCSSVRQALEAPGTNQTSLRLCECSISSTALLVGTE